MIGTTSKKEAPIKNRFVAHLRKTEGLNWTTKSQDVPTRNGRNNFDYLLECDGRALALEITERPGQEKSLSHFSLSIVVWNELLRLVRVEKLGGCILLQTPTSYSISTQKMKAILKKEGRQLAEIIEKASNTLAVGQQVHVLTKLGPCPLMLERIEGPPELSAMSDWGSSGLAQSKLEEIMASFKRTIEAKNQQLDTEADRRVLVIFDNAPLGKVFLPEAAREFFGEDRQDMSNIDEVFIEFRKNDFRKVYPISSRHFKQDLYRGLSQI
jgi:hypothetical protein